MLAATNDRSTITILDGMTESKAPDRGTQVIRAVAREMPKPVYTQLAYQSRDLRFAFSSKLLGRS
jgi:hypothetical protein